MNEIGDERGTASWGARILAPIALLTATVVVIAVAAGSIDGSGQEEAEGPPDRPWRIVDCTPVEPGVVRDGYYVVQPGEPGLSAVAENTCVRIERLQRLNPELDPQLIPQGACVNLRRDGCRALAGG